MLCSVGFEFFMKYNCNIAVPYYVMPSFLHIVDIYRQGCYSVPSLQFTKFIVKQTPFVKLFGMLFELKDKARKDQKKFQLNSLNL